MGGDSAWQWTSIILYKQTSGLQNTSNKESHRVDVEMQSTAITHLYIHVCPRTALATVTLVLEGVQVYACHVLYALCNKHQALLKLHYYSINIKTEKVCFDYTNMYK